MVRRPGRAVGQPSLQTPPKTVSAKICYRSDHIHPAVHPSSHLASPDGRRVLATLSASGRRSPETLAADGWLMAEPGPRSHGGRGWLQPLAPAPRVSRPRPHEQMLRSAHQPDLPGTRADQPPPSSPRRPLGAHPSVRGWQAISSAPESHLQDQRARQPRRDDGFAIAAPSLHSTRAR